MGVEHEPAIRFEQASKRYRRSDGSEVLAADSVDLAIAAGEFVCLVGPSGHGKTTLLQLVSGLERTTAGSVMALGRGVSGPGPDRGLVFQKDSVFPWLRVGANVEYGLRRRGLARQERRAVASHFLAEVGLSGLERSWPRELSGGMLKRVAVATVFAAGADILLLDEPFGALDYVTKRQLHAVLLRLWNETATASGRRRTVLFVTHDVDEALTLADRILVVKEGRIADDLQIRASRPRTDDDLAGADLLSVKHILLRHLGIERLATQPGAGPTSGGPR